MTYTTLKYHSLPLVITYLHFWDHRYTLVLLEMMTWPFWTYDTPYYSVSRIKVLHTRHFEVVILSATQIVQHYSFIPKIICVKYRFQTVFFRKYSKAIINHYSHVLYSFLLFGCPDIFCPSMCFVVQFILMCMHYRSCYSKNQVVLSYCMTHTAYLSMKLRSFFE